MFFMNLSEKGNKHYISLFSVMHFRTSTKKEISKRDFDYLKQQEAEKKLLQFDIRTRCFTLDREPVYLTFGIFATLLFLIEKIETEYIERIQKQWEKNS